VAFGAVKGPAGQAAVNEGRLTTHQALTPATQRLPASFDFPLGGIVGRVVIGLFLLAAAASMLLQSSLLWKIAGIPPAVLGVVAVVSNLFALLDPSRRKLLLDEAGVEIRYGLSRRHYRFLEYSEYRISRVGLRRFLTALPVNVDRALGRRAEHVRVTLYDRPAFLTPMPMLDGGAPATLLQWQSTLNELRRVAIASAEAADGLEIQTGARATGQAGARPSRLSRSAYVRGRLLLALVFFSLLLAPMAFMTAANLGLVAICGTAGSEGCLSIDPTMLQLMMIGGPLLAVLVFVFGHARMAIRRAHDLGEELSFWQAALGAFARRSVLQRQLGSRDGVEGANRFGPAPPA
jgi:uncharacterized membrane protein YhaH (DUF805 family)